MKRTTTACLCYLAMTMGASSLLANGGHGGGGHSGGHTNHGGGGGKSGGTVHHGGNQMQGGSQVRVQGSNAQVGNAVQHHKVQTNSPFQGHGTHHNQGTQQVQNKPTAQHKVGQQNQATQQTNQKVNLNNHVQAHNHNKSGQNSPLGQQHHNGHQNHQNNQNNNAGSFLSQHMKPHQGSNMNPVKHHNNHNNNSNGISHHHFTGNKVAFGKQHVNLSNASYQPSFYKHGNHYHGHWNWNQASNHHHHNQGWNNYGWPGYYNSGWGYQPFIWGVGGWGLGSMVYSSGYVNYYNPYYYSVPATGYCYNYAQPIPVSYNTVVADAGTTTTPLASNVMDEAVLAFQQNDFPKALDLTNQGIQQSPDDAVLHEFRGLVLFAKGDYQQAAATVHSILAVGPGWDWETLSGLYPDVGVYTTQLRALEAYTKQNPQDAAGHFLLAYHYMSDGYPDAAARQLQQVKQLVPNDMVAANLLKMTTSSQSAASTDPAVPPTPNLASANVAQPTPSPTTPPAPAPIDPSVIVGSWTASRDDGSNFGLTLKDDKTFSWSYSPKDQQPQSFDGTYKVEGNVIALERAGGGSLLAEIASNDRSKFNFKMVGAPDEDPGLTFIR